MIFLCSVCLMIVSAVLYLLISQRTATEYVALREELADVEMEYERACASAYSIEDLDAVNRRICGVDYIKYEQDTKAIEDFYTGLFDTTASGLELDDVSKQMQAVILQDSACAYLDKCIPVMLKDGRYYCIVQYTSNGIPYMIGAIHEVSDEGVAILEWDSLVS